MKLWGSRGHDVIKLELDKRWKTNTLEISNDRSNMRPGKIFSLCSAAAAAKFMLIIGLTSNN